MLFEIFWETSIAIKEAKAPPKLWPVIRIGALYFSNKSFVVFMTLKKIILIRLYCDDHKNMNMSSVNDYFYRLILLSNFCELFQKAFSNSICLAISRKHNYVQTHSQRWKTSYSRIKSQIKSVIWLWSWWRQVHSMQGSRTAIL